MKMRAEHYAVLKEKVSKVLPDLPAHRRRLEADSRIKNVAT